MPRAAAGAPGLPVELRDAFGLTAAALDWAAALGAGTDPLQLEALRELRARREHALREDWAGVGPRVEGARKGLEAYLRALEPLVERRGAARLPGGKKKEVSWTSPLADGPAAKKKKGRLYRLATVQDEWGLVFMKYAAAVRERGLEMVAEAHGGGEPGRSAAGEGEAGGVSDAEAAKWLRRAAGVYAFCEAHVLPPMRHKLPAERPAEALPSCALAMQTLCLADAQFIVANHAQQKGSSPKLAASLWQGASDLYEQASKVLKTNLGDYNHLSKRLQAYFAINSAVAQARAISCWSLASEESEKIGEALTLTDAAMAKLDRIKGLGICDQDEAWRAALEQERGGLERLADRYTSSNKIVYFQKRVPPDAVPAAPAGRVIVGPIEFKKQEGDEFSLFSD